MRCPTSIDLVNNGGDRRRFSRTGGAADQHEPGTKFCNLFQRWMQVQLLDGGYGAGEQSDGNAETASGVEDVDADPDMSDGHGQVDGPSLPQGLQLSGREDFLYEPVELAVRPTTGVVELDLAVLAIDNRMAPGDVHIGAAFLHGSHDNLTELVHPSLSPGPVRVSDVESAGRNAVGAKIRTHGSGGK